MKRSSIDEGNDMKVMIFGAEGMLGRELQYVLSKPQSPFKILPLSHKDADIADFEAVKKVIEMQRPSVIINCAAKTNVNECEDDIKSTFFTNANGPENISKVIKDMLITFVHISTGQLFDDKKRGGYTEEDTPLPHSKQINFYSASKLTAENDIKKHLTDSPVRWYIARTQWLYSEFRESFVDFVIEKGIMDNREIIIAEDQFGSPTWARRLAEYIIKLIISGQPPGIYHLANEVNEGEASRLQIAKEICKYFGKSFEETGIKSGKTKDIFKIPRLQYEILKNTKFFKFPYWRDDLRKYLELKYGKQA